MKRTPIRESRWRAAGARSPLIVLATIVFCALLSPSTFSEPVRFNEHIRPIFTQHCTECHGGVKQAADLSFVYPEQVLPPDGWVVEPGKPDESELIARVTSSDAEYRMPPAEHGPPLSHQEIGLLREWIRQGAIWEKHWAFERPRRRPFPRVADKTWCRSSVDWFVLARLEREGIVPSPETSPERWLRRVSFDLIGLPPTPKERVAFLKDLHQRGEPAYESVVDRLLASPGFGERWASVWLDQVRYADSRGLGFDIRRNIWKYRDWVIEAFNRDLPFDQFTIKQLAGDLLPDPEMDDLIASACQRLTQSNDEGGSDDEEFRVEAVLDRVNTMWQVWQGMTFGCVRCHDHPYEPFRHDEYYQFADFFNNSQDSDTSDEFPLMQVPLDRDDYVEARRIDRRIEKLRHEIWETDFALASNANNWKPLSELKAKTNNATKVVVENKSNRAEYHTVGTVAEDTDITLEATMPELDGPFTAIRVACLPLDLKSALRDSEWGFMLSHVEARLLTSGAEVPIDLVYVIGDESAPFIDPQKSLDPESVEGFAAYTRINQPRTAAFVLKQPLDVPPGARLQVILKHRKQVVASFSLISRRGHLAVSDDPAFIDRLADSKRASQMEQLARLVKEREGIESTPLPVTRERPEHLRRPTHVFIRGLYLTKDKQVHANVPASLPPLSDGGKRADRLAMAKWLVSPENPFTARVAVNRVWSQLFGVGLVLTEEDFGSSGEAPSHPELLDHLALRFQSELGWSTKKLLRELVLSSTYRQDSTFRPELEKRDPSNRLLSRGPRVRLAAEMVRDQALAASGLLCEKQFGPPVYPPIPDGVWQPFQEGDKWETPPPGNPERNRRSIYTYTKRSIPYPISAAFDAPSREACTPRRLTSNTPIQALMTLNDEMFVECAEALASRMTESGNTLRDQLRYGFELTTSRSPSETELDDLEAYFGAPSTDEARRNRMKSIASVLLNLDEAMYK